MRGIHLVLAGNLLCGANSAPLVKPGVVAKTFSSKTPFVKSDRNVYNGWCCLEIIAPFGVYPIY